MRTSRFFSTRWTAKTVKTKRRLPPVKTALWMQSNPGETWQPALGPNKWRQTVALKSRYKGARSLGFSEGYETDWLMPNKRKQRKLKRRDY